MKKFIIRMTLFSVIVAGIATGLTYLPNTIVIHKYCWAPILLYYIISILIHGIMSFGKSLGEDSFGQFFLLGTGIKLLSSMVFVAIFLFNKVDDRMLFVINFFVVYLLYTGFDIYSLIANLRPQSKSSKET